MGVESCCMAIGSHGFCTQIIRKQNSKAPENTDPFSLVTKICLETRHSNNFSTPTVQYKEYIMGVKLREEVMTTTEMFNVNLNKLHAITPHRAPATIGK
jgi:hypothetical protein